MKDYWVIDVRTTARVDWESYIPIPSAPKNWKDPEKIERWKAEKETGMNDIMPFHPIGGKVEEVFFHRVRYQGIGAANLSVFNNMLAQEGQVILCGFSTLRKIRQIINSMLDEGLVPSENLLTAAHKWNYIDFCSLLAGEGAAVEMLKQFYHLHEDDDFQAAIQLARKLFGEEAK